MGNPMYRQIAEELREQIESGALRPGQQLLTEFELRDHYGASRNTIRDAIKWLTGLGLVEAKPGQGAFVVQRTDPFVTTLTADRKRPGGSEVFAPGEDGYGEIDGSEVNDQKTRAVRVTDPSSSCRLTAGSGCSRSWKQALTRPVLPCVSPRRSCQPIGIIFSSTWAMCRTERIT